MLSGVAMKTGERRFVGMPIFVLVEVIEAVGKHYGTEDLSA